MEKEAAPLLGLVVLAFAVDSSKRKPMRHTLEIKTRTANGR